MYFRKLFQLWLFIKLHWTNHQALQWSLMTTDLWIMGNNLFLLCVCVCIYQVMAASITLWTRVNEVTHNPVPHVTFFTGALALQDTHTQSDLQHVPPGSDHTCTCLRANRCLWRVLVGCLTCPGPRCLQSAFGLQPPRVCRLQLLISTHTLPSPVQPSEHTQDTLPGPTDTHAA